MLRCHQCLQRSGSDGQPGWQDLPCRFPHEDVPVNVKHLVANNIYIFGIRGEGKSGTLRAAAFMNQKRFDATLIHTHTFDMGELPEAIRYAKDRVEDAIKVVVKNNFADAKKAAAE